MKKLLLTAFVILLSPPLFAQTEHFTFRDIPINGSEEEMGAKLKELGYTPTVSPSKYEGKFIGEDCSIFLFSSEYTGSVYSVVVNFSPIDNWSSLKSDYVKIKDLCASKYGKPLVSRQSFDRPYYEGDGYEMSAVRLNKCNYFSLWQTDNGEVTLVIVKDRTIALYYSDKINEDLHDQAKESAARNDI